MHIENILFLLATTACAEYDWTKYIIDEDVWSIGNAESHLVAHLKQTCGRDDLQDIEKWKCSVSISYLEKKLEIPDARIPEDFLKAFKELTALKNIYSGEPQEDWLDVHWLVGAIRAGATGFKISDSRKVIEAAKTAKLDVFSRYTLLGMLGGEGYEELDSKEWLESSTSCSGNRDYGCMAAHPYAQKYIFIRRQIEYQKYSPMEPMEVKKQRLYDAKFCNNLKINFYSRLQSANPVEFMDHLPLSLDDWLETSQNALKILANPYIAYEGMKPEDIQSLFRTTLSHSYNGYGRNLAEIAQEILKTPSKHTRDQKYIIGWLLGKAAQLSVRLNNLSFLNDKDMRDGFDELIRRGVTGEAQEQVDKCLKLTYVVSPIASSSNATKQLRNIQGVPEAPGIPEKSVKDLYGTSQLTGTIVVVYETIEDKTDSSFHRIESFLDPYLPIFKINVSHLAENQINMVHGMFSDREESTNRIGTWLTQSSDLRALERMVTLDLDYNVKRLTELSTIGEYDYSGAVLWLTRLEYFAFLVLAGISTSVNPEKIRLKLEDLLKLRHNLLTSSDYKESLSPFTLGSYEFSSLLNQARVDAVPLSELFIGFYTGVMDAKDHKVFIRDFFRYIRPSVREATAFRPLLGCKYDLITGLLPSVEMMLQLRRALIDYDFRWSSDYNDVVARYQNVAVFRPLVLRLNLSRKNFEQIPEDLKSYLGSFSKQSSNVVRRLLLANCQKYLKSVLFDDDFATARQVIQEISSESIYEALSPNWKTDSLEVFHLLLQIPALQYFIVDFFHSTKPPGAILALAKNSDFFVQFETIQSNYPKETLMEIAFDAEAKKHVCDTVRMLTGDTLDSLLEERADLIFPIFADPRCREEIVEFWFYADDIEKHYKEAFHVNTEGPIAEQAAVHFGSHLEMWVLFENLLLQKPSDYIPSFLENAEISDSDFMKGLCEDHPKFLPYFYRKQSYSRIVDYAADKILLKDFFEVVQSNPEMVDSLSQREAYNDLIKRVFQILDNVEPFVIKLLGLGDQENDVAKSICQAALQRPHLSFLFTKLFSQKPTKYIPAMEGNQEFRSMLTEISRTNPDFYEFLLNDPEFESLVLEVASKDAEVVLLILRDHGRRDMIEKLAPTFPADSFHILCQSPEYHELLAGLYRSHKNEINEQVKSQCKYYLEKMSCWEGYASLFEMASRYVHSKVLYSVLSSRLEVLKFLYSNGIVPDLMEKYFLGTDKCFELYEMLFGRPLAEQTAYEISKIIESNANNVFLIANIMSKQQSKYFPLLFEVDGAEKVIKKVIEKVGYIDTLICESLPPKALQFESLVEQCCLISPETTARILVGQKEFDVIGRNLRKYPRKLLPHFIQYEELSGLNISILEDKTYKELLPLAFEHAHLKPLVQSKVEDEPLLIAKLLPFEHHRDFVKDKLENDFVKYEPVLSDILLKDASLCKYMLGDPIFEPLILKVAHLSPNIVLPILATSDRTDLIDTLEVQKPGISFKTLVRFPKYKEYAKKIYESNKEEIEGLVKNDPQYYLEEMCHWSGYAPLLEFVIGISTPAGLCYVFNDNLAIVKFLYFNRIARDSIHQYFRNTTKHSKVYEVLFGNLREQTPKDITAIIESDSQVVELISMMLLKNPHKYLRFVVGIQQLNQQIRDVVYNNIATCEYILPQVENYNLLAAFCLVKEPEMAMPILIAAGEAVFIKTVADNNPELIPYVLKYPELSELSGTIIENHLGKKASLQLAFQYPHLNFITHKKVEQLPTLVMNLLPYKHHRQFVKMKLEEEEKENKDTYKSIIIYGAKASKSNLSELMDFGTPVRKILCELATDSSLKPVIKESIATHFVAGFEETTGWEYLLPPVPQSGEGWLHAPDMKVASWMLLVENILLGTEGRLEKVELHYTWGLAPNHYTFGPALDAPMASLLGVYFIAGFHYKLRKEIHQLKEEILLAAAELLHSGTTKKKKGLIDWFVEGIRQTTHHCLFSLLTFSEVYSILKSCSPRAKLPSTALFVPNLASSQSLDLTKPPSQEKGMKSEDYELLLGKYYWNETLKYLQGPNGVSYFASDRFTVTLPGKPIDAGGPSRRYLSVLVAYLEATGALRMIKIDNKEIAVPDIFMSPKDAYLISLALAKAIRKGLSWTLPVDYELVTMLPSLTREKARLYYDKIKHQLFQQSMKETSKHIWRPIYNNPVKTYWVAPIRNNFKLRDIFTPSGPGMYFRQGYDDKLEPELRNSSPWSDNRNTKSTDAKVVKVLDELEFSSVDPDTAVLNEFEWEFELKKTLDYYGDRYFEVLVAMLEGFGTIFTVDNLGKIRKELLYTPPITNAEVLKYLKFSNSKYWEKPIPSLIQGQHMRTEDFVLSCIEALDVPLTANFIQLVTGAKSVSKLRLEENGILISAKEEDSNADRPTGNWGVDTEGSQYFDIWGAYKKRLVNIQARMLKLTGNDFKSVEGYALPVYEMSVSTCGYGLSFLVKLPIEEIIEDQKKPATEQQTQRLEAELPSKGLSIAAYFLSLVAGFNPNNAYSLA